VVAIPLAAASTTVSCVLYVLVAIMWLVPDPRMAKAVEPDRR